jgi:hypothetical protein
MNISGITSTASYQPLQTSSSNNNPFKQLASALQNGDLSGAQAAFQALQKVGSKSSGTDSDGDHDGSVSSASASSSTKSSSPLANDFQALQAALGDNDLNGAQQAFKTLQQDLKAAHGHHHHGGGAPAVSSTSQSASEVDSLLSTTGTTASTTASSTTGNVLNALA